MIYKKGLPYRELRCMKCRSLLALEYIFAGRLSIKCHVCNSFNDIDCKASKQVLLDEGGIKNTKLFSVNENEKGGENING